MSALGLTVLIVGVPFIVFAVFYVKAMNRYYNGDNKVRYTQSGRAFKI